MKILVLYRLLTANSRNTIFEHLYSFKKYYKKAHYHYYNVTTGIPKYLTKIKYDGIILHYTFLSARFKLSNSAWIKYISNIKELKGFKVAIPQDEYVDTNKLCVLFKSQNISIVFTCFNRKHDWLLAYPKKETNLKAYKPVLTGYVDVDEIKNLKLKDYRSRPIDIGYRARKLPYYLGLHGQLKYKLAIDFKKKLKNTNYSYDISFTDKNDRNAFLSKEWYLFLNNCKAFLGCEGGASLLDKTGEIRKLVDNYIKLNPKATFQETEKACFKGKDFNINCFTVSPRHFEAAMTKTLQILVEGHYGGILKPDLHFIKLNKDFSNINDVLLKLQDHYHCQKIINRAYKDIVLSKKYSYKKFTQFVIDSFKKNVRPSDFNIKDEILFNFTGYFIIIRNVFLSFMYKLMSLFVYRPLRYFGINSKIDITKRLFNYK